jgi:hypothetical protein
LLPPQLLMLLLLALLLLNLAGSWATLPATAQLLHVQLPSSMCLPPAVPNTACHPLLPCNGPASARC